MSWSYRASESKDRTFILGGVTLRDCGREEAVRLVMKAVHGREAIAVHLCNAYTVSLAAKDDQYAAALNRRSLNLVDGTPVAWHYRLLTGRSADGPVRGPSFMRRMLDEPGVRHFLYGGTDELLLDLRREITASHPNATICGAIAPPFRPMNDSDLGSLIAELQQTEADIVWVGLGTPKQDYFLDRLAAAHNCVGIGIGAAFDFLAGHKREAPVMLQELGLEWAHRLLTEPRRLWKRYLLGNIGFLGASMKAMWAKRGKKNHLPT